MKSLPSHEEEPCAEISLSPHRSPPHTGFFQLCSGWQEAETQRSPCCPRPSAVVLAVYSTWALGTLGLQGPGPTLQSWDAVLAVAGWKTTGYFPRLLQVRNLPNQRLFLYVKGPTRDISASHEHTETRKINHSIRIWLPQRSQHLLAPARAWCSITPGRAKGTHCSQCPPGKSWAGYCSEWKTSAQTQSCQRWRLLSKRGPSCAVTLQGSTKCQTTKGEPHLCLKLTPACLGEEGKKGASESKKRYFGQISAGLPKGEFLGTYTFAWMSTKTFKMTHSHYV